MTESRRDRHKAERREWLFETAMSLFVEHGFAATTVDDIADAADVARATFFNYYGSKDAVLLELHGRLQRRVLATTEALLDEPLGVRERFERHFRELAEMILAEGDRVRVLVRALHLSAGLRTAENDAVSRVLELYAGFLRDGVRRGELRADIEVPVATQLIAGAWTITVLSWAYGVDPDPAGTILKKIEIIFRGLKSQAAHPRRA